MTSRFILRLLGASVLVVAVGCGSQQKQGTTAAKAATGPAAKGAAAGGGAADQAGPVVIGAGGTAEATPIPSSPRRGSNPELDNLTRAAAELVRSRQYEAAIASAKQVLRRDERHVPAMIVMARAYYHVGKYELATAICNIAKGIDPNYAETYFVLGLVALKQDNRPGALAAFKKATELDNNFAAAWNNLGAQYLAAKNYSAAVTAFTRAAQLSGTNAAVHLNLGSAYRGNQEPKRAEAEYLRATQLKSGYAEAYFNLGILYLDTENFPGLDQVRRLDLAVQNFQRYKQLRGPAISRDDPVDGYIEEARKGIEREQKARLRKAKAREELKKAPKKGGAAGGGGAKAGVSVKAGAKAGGGVKVEGNIKVQGGKK